MLCQFDTLQLLTITAQCVYFYNAFSSCFTLSLSLCVFLAEQPRKYKRLNRSECCLPQIAVTVFYSSVPHCLSHSFSFAPPLPASPSFLLICPSSFLLHPHSFSFTPLPSCLSLIPSPLPLFLPAAPSFLLLACHSPQFPALPLHFPILPQLPLSISLVEEYYRSCQDLGEKIAPIREVYRTHQEVSVDTVVSCCTVHNMRRRLDGVLITIAVPLSTACNLDT